MICLALYICCRIWTKSGLHKKPLYVRMKEGARTQTLSLLQAEIALSLNLSAQGPAGLKHVGVRRCLESRGLAGQLPSSADGKSSC